jgi:NADH-quinone oxidoreductase subunit N
MEPTLLAVQESLRLMAGETFLAGYAMVLAVLGAFMGDRYARVLSGLTILVLLVAAFGTVLYAPIERTYAFGTSIVVDPLTAWAKAALLLAAAISVQFASVYFGREGNAKFEYPLLIVLATIGMCIMVGANDLITMYVGIELNALAAYVLAAFRRDDGRSSEAGLKYFVLGALSSGMLLYGSSLIYGFTGSMQFADIAKAADGGSIGLIFGIVFVLSALAFKISAAPFHMWTPDVYEGSPGPVTAFFATAPKVAGVILMARVLMEPLGGLHDRWGQVIAAIAAISMVVGALGALIQTNIKRLMAYSSIANMGYVLMALAAGTAKGVEAAIIYLAVYIPVTIGVFAGILAMRRNGEPVETISDLSGLAKEQPFRAVIFTILFFSLAGVPPLVGFFGKLQTFLAALDAGMVILAVIGALATVIGAAYYLRLMKIMWFDQPAEKFAPAGATYALTLAAAALLAFPVLLFALGPIETGVKQMTAIYLR